MFHRVNRGQRVAIRATEWNAILDVVERDQRQRATLEGPAERPHPFAPNVVRIKNNTNQDLPRFGVLRVSGAVSDPSDDETLAEEFLSRPALIGTTATPSSVNIVVLLEPIKQGEFGRAAASGVFACKLDVCSTADRFATPILNDPTKLQTAAAGPVLVLWASDSGTDRYAVVSM